MDTTFVDIVRQAVPGASLELTASRDMVTAYVDRDHLVAVCQTLRDHADLQFAFLADITTVDLLPASPRFEIVYHLACLGAACGTAPARRLRLKVRLSGDDPRVPTVSGVWASANWAEREVFDLFGVDFVGHPDQRRVLMPDDWQGHPLRKDSPVQIRKDADATSPIQVTEAEFVANMKAAREQAVRAAQAIAGGRGSGTRGD